MYYYGHFFWLNFLTILNVLLQYNVLREKCTCHQWTVMNFHTVHTPGSPTPSSRNRPLSVPPEGPLLPLSTHYPHRKGQHSSNFYRKVLLFQITHSCSEEFKCSKIRDSEKQMVLTCLYADFPQRHPSLTIDYESFLRHLCVCPWTAFLF